MDGAWETGGQTEAAICIFRIMHYIQTAVCGAKRKHGWGCTQQTFAADADVRAKLAGGSDAWDDSLVAFWTTLETSWALLGRLGGHLEPSWANLEPSLTVLGESWAIFGSFWAVLGRSWGLLGGLLGSSWDSLGPSWGHLEASKAYRKRKGEKARIIDFI